MPIPVRAIACGLIAMGVVLAAALAMAVIIAALTPALAHGDAEWIQKNYPSCCGKDDCRPTTARLVRGGYLLPTRELVPHERVQPSTDKQFWVCRYQNGWGSYRCFFAPMPAM